MAVQCSLGISDRAGVILGSKKTLLVTSKAPSGIQGAGSSRS